ncbi:MAG: Fibronectin type domain protein [Chthoniobacteraceae bacterium]|nr:Fibronectin type domain protein [Chthoniobacteraceae bacterium]
MPDGVARKADPPELPKAPPQPVSPIVRVKRGESVEIPLKIYGTRSQTLDFLIRVPPQTGKLSEIKRIAQEAGSITYTPSKDLIVKRDKFSYAVRSNEGVSAAVEVAITILDTDPDLFAPETTDFGRTLSGEQVTRNVEITNRGGGIAEGNLEVEPPWQIDGPLHYRLNAGTKSSIKLIFSPKSVGSARGLLRYGPETQCVTALTGESLPPISILPAKLLLKQSEGEKGVRSATLEIFNNTASEQTITPLEDDRFIFSSAATIKPLSEGSIHVETVEANLAALDGEIRLHSTAGEISVPVHGDAVPPILQITRESVNFGAIPFGGNAREQFGIKNRGGTSTTVTMEIAAPYFLQQPAITLSPGEQKELTIGLLTANPGSYRSTLLIRARSLANLEIPVTAQIAQAVGFATPSRTERPVLVAASRPRVIAANRHEEIASASTEGLPLQLAQIVELTPTMAILDWVEPNPGTVHSKIEVRQLSLEGGQLKLDWKEMGSFVPEFKNGRMKGTLTRLEPGALYTIRIRAIKADQSSVVRCEAQFKTPPKKPLLASLFTPLRILAGLLVMALGGVIWQKIGRRPAARC